MSNPGSTKGDSRAAPARVLNNDEVALLWATYTSGGIPGCPRDQTPMALSVDGASKSYRLVCTRCGNASLWFEPASSGIRVRSADDTLLPGPPED